MCENVKMGAEEKKGKGCTKYWRDGSMTKVYTTFDSLRYACRRPHHLSQGGAVATCQADKHGGQSRPVSPAGEMHGSSSYRLPYFGTYLVYLIGRSAGVSWRYA